MAALLLASDLLSKEGNSFVGFCSIGGAGFFLGVVSAYVACLAILLYSSHPTIFGGAYPSQSRTAKFGNIPLVVSAPASGRADLFLMRIGQLAAAFCQRHFVPGFGRIHLPLLGCAHSGDGLWSVSSSNPGDAGSSRRDVVAVRDQGPVKGNATAFKDIGFRQTGRGSDHFNAEGFFPVFLHCLLKDGARSARRLLDGMPMLSPAHGDRSDGLSYVGFPACGACDFVDTPNTFRYRGINHCSVSSGRTVARGAKPVDAGWRFAPYSEDIGVIK